MDVRHPLFGARLRADRAKQPIRSIKRNLQKWTEAHWDYIHIPVDERGHALADPEGYVAFEQRGTPDIRLLAKTSVWLGEALYNMRSALDYLVFTLAMVGNNGSPVQGTQFPIEDDMDRFNGRVTGRNATNGEKMAAYLHKVPAPAIDRIRQLQPCASPPCNWTRLLRDLSNPDKHRYLTELHSRAILVAGNHPELELARVPPELRKHPHLVVEILFRSPRLDVVDTLELLQREVSAVVQEFEPVLKFDG